MHSNVHYPCVAVSGLFKLVLETLNIHDPIHRKFLQLFNTFHNSSPSGSILCCSSPIHPELVSLPSLLPTIFFIGLLFSAFLLHLVPVLFYPVCALEFWSHVPTIAISELRGTALYYHASIILLSRDWFFVYIWLSLFSFRQIWTLTFFSPTLLSWFHSSLSTAMF